MGVSSELYGVPVTTSEAAAEFWSAGVLQSLSFDHSGIDELQAAVDLDPEFALGFACLAKQQSIHGFRESALISLDDALSLGTTANAQEASQISIVESALTFQPQTLDLALAHCREWPSDVIVLASLVGPFGLLAFSGRPDWQAESVELLQSRRLLWSDDDWWFMAARAFALGEVGELDPAMRLAERAWELRPCGNCAHTLSHVHFEQEALQEGAAFLQEWLASYGQTSDMRHHLLWHHALINMQNGNASGNSMLELYRTELDPAIQDPMPLTTFADNASLFWRCHIYDMPLPLELAEQTIHYAEKYFPVAGFPFADMHKLSLHALTQTDDSELINGLEKLDDPEMKQYFQQLWQGFSAFVANDFKTAINSLEWIVHDTVRLGGSNPQRQLVHETLVQARNKLKSA